MKPLTRQHWFILTLAALVVAFLFFACKKEPNPVTPSDNRPILISADYRKVVLKLIDYDVVQVTHQMGLDLRSRNVVGIGIGTKDSAVYKPLLAVVTTYDPSSQTYAVHYDFTVRLDSTLIQAPITIRYYFADLSYADADTTVLLYKYPYKSTEVFVTNSIMIDTGMSFHDIDRIGTKFFFDTGNLAYGALYEYDLQASRTRLLLIHNRGGKIAADSVFVFCGSSSVLARVSQHQVQRYNTLKDSVDVGFPSLRTLFIHGMATYNRRLYVFLDDLTLQVFTLEGVPVDTIRYPMLTAYLTIDDSIVYGVDYNSALNQISRFDLRTRSFRSNLVAPAKYLEGIRIHGNQLYFCNRSKNFVGIMPLADLKPVQ